MKLLPTIILALAVAIEAFPNRNTQQAQGTWRNGVWVPSQSSGSTGRAAAPALPSFEEFSAFVRAGANKKASQSKNN